jgi:starvation-inducible DNA-binding protein
METLQELMKKALADTYAMYLKTQNYHWNVEGFNFAQYHEFFGSIYAELGDAIDPMAEEIRTLDTYAPASFTRFLELTDIEDEMAVPDASEMCRRLLADNTKVLNTLDYCFKMSETLNKQGLVDFIAGRIDAHEKHGWMLRSSLK